MLVTFLERAAISRMGPMFMVGEHADLPEAVAEEFLALGVVERAASPAPPDAPAAPTPPDPAPAPVVDKPPVDKMQKRGDAVRK